MSEKIFFAGIDPKELALFFALLETHTGIAMDESKEYLLSSRLGGLARDCAITSVAALIVQLNRTPVGPLHWQAFDLMATHETFFFRDKSYFDLIKNEIIPSVMKANAVSQEMNIWCAAASTGQEPYSLAILLEEEFPALHNWKVSIHATDMSDSCLEQARLGIYNSFEINRGLSEAQMKLHFNELETGEFRIHSTLHQWIQFYHLNLLKDWPKLPLFDLILLRNTLIYFNSETKMAVLKKIHAQLSNLTGYLMLGSAESILFDNRFSVSRSDRLTYYRRA
jgi:chemotaxis protein methyltransferase CheR